MSPVDPTPDNAWLKVCVYGGSRRDGTPLEYVSNLSEQVLLTLPAVIVTGGYVGSDGETSEQAALTGAQRVARATVRPLNTLYEAWLPDAGAAPDPARMSAALGITVRELTGRTALARRLTMIAGGTSW